MRILHDPGHPDDPVLTSFLLWLLCAPLAMGIEIVRRVRLDRQVKTVPYPTATASGARTSGLTEPMS